MTAYVGLARRDRIRRGKIFMTAMGLNVAVLLGLALLAPRGPVHALGLFAFCGLQSVLPLYVTPRDPRMRQRTLGVFALGAAAGLAWVAYQAVRQAVDPAFLARPSEVLLATGLAWVAVSLGWELISQLRTRAT